MKRELLFWELNKLMMNVSHKKINIISIALFIIYLLGYFTISKTLIPMFCISQVYLIENIVSSRSKTIRSGQIIIIIASLIFFIASILNL